MRARSWLLRAGVLFGLAMGGASSLRAAEPTDAPAGATLSDDLVPVRLGEPRALGAATAPRGWTETRFDDRAWVASPSAAFRARPPGVPGAVLRGATLIDVPPGGALLMRRRFDVERPERVRVLELRVAYGDGFVAYVNGREVARRALEPGAARPSVPHGPEAEAVYVPLSRAEARRLLLPAGNVLAVEIRAASAAGLGTPWGHAQIEASAAARIVRGPYLLAPEGRDGRYRVSVAWETDLPAAGQVVVERERDGGDRRIVRAPGRTLRQVVRLPSLDAGARYRYRVIAKPPGERDVVRGPFALEVPPPPDRPFRFVVYGDMRSGVAHAEVVSAILREQVSLIVNTGDLVATGSEESDWQRYFEVTAPLGARAAVVPALGNHEAYRGGAAKSWTLFGLRSEVPGAGVTSVDVSGVHIVVLDTNHVTHPGQQAWLAADLARARRSGARAIIAVCHHGAWAHGIHGGSPAMERQLAPILAGAGADVLFSGHDHLYERGVGQTARGALPYVVTGGGGAPLYNPSCTLPGRPVAAGAPGAPAAPPCPPSVVTLEKTYHYVLVTVDERGVELCPRRPDGSAVEPCALLPRRRQARP